MKINPFDSKYKFTDYDEISQRTLPFDIDVSDAISLKHNGVLIRTFDRVEATILKLHETDGRFIEVNVYLGEDVIVMFSVMDRCLSIDRIDKSIEFN